MTKQQDSLKQELEISLLFDNARIELDVIEELSQKEKKQVVKDLAKHLEGLIQTDTICIEIITQLRGKVSGRFIRECLDDKYKQKHKAENARKQKKLQELEDNENLAAVTPLNQEEETENKEVVITQDVQGRSIEEKEQKKNLNPPPTYDKAVTDNNAAARPPGLKDQSKHGLKECSRCKELDLEICELKEALSRETTLIRANEIHTYETKYTITKEKYLNLEEAMQRSRDSITVVFDKGGILDCAISDIFTEGN